jgi:hypothetical protein
MLNNQSRNEGNTFYHCAQQQIWHGLSILLSTFYQIDLSDIFLLRLKVLF